MATNVSQTCIFGNFFLNNYRRKFTVSINIIFSEFENPNFKLLPIIIKCFFSFISHTFGAAGSFCIVVIGCKLKIFILKNTP